MPNKEDRRGDAINLRMNRAMWPIPYQSIPFQLAYIHKGCLFPNQFIAFLYFFVYKSKAVAVFSAWDQNAPTTSPSVVNFVIFGMHVLHTATWSEAWVVDMQIEVFLRNFLLDMQ